MGDARRRALQAQPIDPEVIERVATAVRKLFQAASGQYISDCWGHAAMGQALLQRLGVRAEIAGGEAAWRVGEGDGDMITHAKMDQAQQHGPEGAYPFHAWLELSGHILDLTTYQLWDKARALDAADGGHTTVDWCPDYLLTAKAAGRSLLEVRQQHAGMFHYRRDLAIEGMLKRNSRPVDPADLETAWLICQNPGMKVMGPNNLR